MNSCMANLLPAWEPPLITLNAGTGKIISGVPAKSAMCLQSKDCYHPKTKCLDSMHILVKRNAFKGSSSFAHGQRNAQNGISAKFRLILSSIQLQHEFVDDSLVVNFEIFFQQCWR